MSRERLSDRLRDLAVPQAVDAREQAVAEARAEVAGRTATMPVHREGPRRALALAAAALLAIVFLLTPPGRAASAWVGELVGIGEVGGEPTQRYRSFGVDGTAVVIDNGRAPDGQRYEWVAFECRLPTRAEAAGAPDGDPSGRSAGVGTSFEWPGVKGYEGGGHCETLENRPPANRRGLASHGVHIVPSQFKGVERPDLVISGQTGADVHDVKVIYVEPDGTERELPVDFARVEGELGELAHRPEPMGTFVAFLSGDVAARDEVEQRLDLRALLDTGKLKLGPIARRERELAQAARERCERFEPSPADFPEDRSDQAAFERLFKPLVDCHEREMPPSPFEYVLYDADGREVGRESEPLITAAIVRPGDIEPAGHEQPGDERGSLSHLLPRRSEPVLIMSGRAPDGALYEVVVSKSKQMPDPCMTTWWPYVFDAVAGGGCGGFPPEGAYGRENPEDVAARPLGFLNSVPQATAHHMLSGFARPFVSRVRIVYEGRDGERHDAPVKLKQVRGPLAERIEAREPAGYWVAFLPRSAGKRPVVEVIAYDEDGKVASRIDYRA